MTPRPIRVLVVDDSAFARKVLREVLSDVPELEVVGAARDGLEALEKIAELKPDVLTLDLVMPNLDGLGVLRSLPEVGAPRVVLVSISDVHSELAVQALASGAIDLVRKPTALATDQLYELRSELVSKVTAAARAHVPRASVATLPPPLPQGELATKLVVVGTSTGGPQALTRLLSAIPQDFPVPIAIALHIPAGYTEALAARLDQLCAIHVVEAHDGLELKPGMAVIARGGSHLTIERAGADIRVRTPLEPRNVLHTPSVDLLFQSAAQACGEEVVAVVLTGMGDDGCRGARALRDQGAVVLTETEASCVIYGMPRAVFEAGLSNEAAPLDAMASRIVARLR